MGRDPLKQSGAHVRRYRFSIRSLLLVVGLCAFACWAYWFGWPWWQEYRFESRLKTLKAGVTVSEVMRIAQGSTTIFCSHGGTEISMTSLMFQNRPYCVCSMYSGKWDKGLSEWPCASVRAFRFSQATGSIEHDLTGELIYRLATSQDANQFPARLRINPRRPARSGEVKPKTQPGWLIRPLHQLD